MRRITSCQFSIRVLEGTLFDNKKTDHKKNLQEIILLEKLNISKIQIDLTNCLLDRTLKICKDEQDRRQ